MVHIGLTYAMYSTKPPDVSTGHGSGTVVTKTVPIKSLSVTFTILFERLAYRRKSAEYYIEAARKRFSMDLEDVILFLNFFIEHCSSKSAKDWWAGCLKKRKQIAKRLNGWTSDNENWNWTLEGKDREAFRTLVKSLVQMTTFISRIFLKLVELQFKVPISAE